jgi:hypothetical protein
MSSCTPYSFVEIVDIEINKINNHYSAVAKKDNPLKIMGLEAQVREYKRYIYFFWILSTISVLINILMIVESTSQ